MLILLRKCIDMDGVQTSTIFLHLVRLYCHLAISRSSLTSEVRNGQEFGTFYSQLKRYSATCAGFVLHGNLQYCANCTQDGKLR